MPPEPDDPITPLAIAFQDGDPDAFAQLVDSLQERFYRIAYRVVGNPDTALDVVQDAFVKIHGNIGSWDRRSRFFSWSYRVVTNLAIDGLRKKGRERKAWETRAATAVEFQEDTSSDGLLEQERARLVVRVKNAIEQLPPGQRAIVALRHYESFSLKEIAEVRGCALGTVKSTLHQAFRSLRRSLGRELLEQVAGEASA
jgi:RNA polymerase sigma-70 factor (ECF subfamily)